MFVDSDINIDRANETKQILEKKDIKTDNLEEKEEKKSEKIVKPRKYGILTFAAAYIAFHTVLVAFFVGDGIDNKTYGIFIGVAFFLYYIDFFVQDFIQEREEYKKRKRKKIDNEK
ncbi:MAG: hypothetical protein ACOX19_03010 [Fermentimonas sp.]